MTNIRAQHANCCESVDINEGQCRMVPPGEPRFILRGTHYQARHKFPKPLCDYIVFWKDDIAGYSVVIIELKGGNIRRDVRDQLMNGGTVANSLISVKVSRFAVVLTGNKSPHPQDRKVLARVRIRFQGKDYPIKTVRCGSEVVKVFPDQKPAS